ncbi:MAG TPA: hypothetical protein VJH22_06305 [Candidatus Nanoarchaeia archaeon]|nr:hypothetical protein [Candidatus Nanoarchaeia archaeon]
MVHLSWYSLRQYFKYDESELRALGAMSVIFAFILSFDQWGVGSFQFLTGIKNFVIALIIVGASVLIHDTAHRLLAIKMGYAAKVKMWWYGLLFCLLVVFATNGAVKLFVGCSIWFTYIAARRLTKFEYYYAPKHLALMAMGGPAANLLFAGVIRSLAGYLPLNPEAVNDLVYFNVVYGVLSFLPIPPLHGSKFFFYGRLAYVFVAAAMLGYTLLHLLGYPSMLISLILGMGAWIWWWSKGEGELEFGKYK